MPKKQITTIKSMEMVEHHRIVGLRLYINLQLAKQDITNAQAAERAGVPQSRWSQLKTADTLTPHDLGRVAAGLGVSIEELLLELEL